jgi:mannose-6-phosphate isomerase-like protein (cupin superfamily)
MSDLGFALIVAGLLLISIIVGFRIVKPLSKHGLLVSVPSQRGREVDMRLGAIVLVLFGATLAWPETTETAEAAYSSSRFKTVIATAALSYTTRPIYFSVIAGTFWAGETNSAANGDGIYYQYSGTTEIVLEGKSTTLQSGEGVFIPNGTSFTPKTTDTRPPTYLQFLLASNSQPNDPDSRGGTRIEIYRSPSPISGLTQKDYILSLSKVPVPPQAPPDPLHRRSGAALHYVVSGVGAEIAEGRASAKGPGSISYEPSELMYQWSNPGMVPLIYLVFNLNPKGEDAVVLLNDSPHAR